MSLNKKVLSIAVAGLLASGSAFAADLSAPGGAVPAYFAKEIVATPAAPVTLGTSTSTDTQLTWDIGYNFSDNEVRFVRVEVSDNMAFGASTTVASTGSAVIGSINGIGTNVLTFSVTSPVGTPIVAADSFQVVGDHAITGTDQNVTATVGVYDLPSQAQNGGTDGLIPNTQQSGAYISFAQSYELVNVIDNTNVAEVESDPSFSEFNPTESDDAIALIAWVGQLAYQLRDPDGPTGVQTATFRIDGNPITLGDLFDSTTSISFAGDLSAYNNACFFGPCVTPTAPATTLSSPVSFDVGATPVSNYFSVQKPASTLIQESEYFATLHAVPNASGDYAVSDITNVRVGEIVRNGTQLQAPLVQLPGGGRYLSRVVLTNTGNADRAYTITAQTEEGVSVVEGNMTGVIPANKTVVLNVSDIVSFPGQARATLNVTVAGPDKQIQGLYQIVDVDNGGISNETMVRPGTN